MAAAARELRADCARCIGLCCVATAFAASADFAITKPAGRACPNLSGTARCTIHSGLQEAGFRGCVAFDCLGAGQRVVEELCVGVDWRTDARAGAAMFDAFHAAYPLHELLWLLDRCLALPGAVPLHDEVRETFAQVDALVDSAADPVRVIDVYAVRSVVNELLTRVSDLVRSASTGPRVDLRGVDLAGADLRRRDLRGANLRGALLIRADLRGVDLALADCTGADLRDADLRGADLRGALFLMPSQLASTRT